MKMVKFDCEFVDGEARVSAYITPVEHVDEYEYFPCDDKETYLDTVEYLDAKEEMLGGLHDVVNGMMGAIRHAEKELFIERAEMEDA